MLHLLYASRQDGIATEYNARVAQRGLSEYLRALPEGDEVLQASIRSAATNLYGSVLASSGKEWFLDKTPRYYLVIPELMNTFPEATFLFLVRNPLDVFSSILAYHAGGDWTKLGRMDLLNDLTTAPEAIRRAISSGKASSRLVRYEDLVTDPERTLRMLCETIGIGFEGAMLRYNRASRATPHLGDNVRVDQHERPVRDYVSAWPGRLDNDLKRGLALSYLRDLDPATTATFGYERPELERQLLSHLDGRARKASERAWRTLSTPPSQRTWRERLWLVSARSLHERGVVRTIGRAVYIVGRGKAPHPPKDSGVTT
jgi:hypothetical protein